MFTLLKRFIVLEKLDRNSEIKCNAKCVCKAGGDFCLTVYMLGGRLQGSLLYQINILDGSNA